MELISVILPIYKVERYLNRCVESIVNQTYANLEIILVDDGSPDGCPVMCDAWAEKDRRIRVIHKQNGGLSDARNAGVAIATGAYIGFVDSDDWIDLDFYEKLLTSIKECNAQIAAADVVLEYADHSERFKEYEQKIFTSEEALKTIIQGNGFHATAWNKLYRADIICQFPYPVGRLHEDEFVTYKVIDKAQRLALCQQTAYHYRQRQGSIMNSISEKHLDAIDAFLERLRFFEKCYPALYSYDKPCFCMTLAAYYKNSFVVEDQAVRRRIQNKLQKYRRGVRYTYTEFNRYDLKQKLYVLGTRISLDLFCRVLSLRG